MSRTKAQVSIEFLMLLIFMSLIFLTFVPFFWRQQVNIENENEYVIGRKLSLSIKKEIDTAVMFGSGYKRNFTLPEEISKSDYVVSINNKTLKVAWKDRMSVEYLIAHEIEGSIIPGKNRLENKNDVICINGAC